MKRIIRRNYDYRAAGTQRHNSNVLTLAFTLIGVMLWPPLVVAENVLKTIEHSAVGEQGVRVVVTAEQVFDKVPANFSINDPARVVIDLPDTSVAMDSKTMAIGSGGVSSIDAVEAAGRSRLVVNLERDMPYHLYTENNQLILTLGEVPKGEALEEPTETAPGVAATEATMVSGGAAAEPASPSIQAEPVAPASLIKTVDFQRTDSGSGLVLLDLSEPDVSIREEERSGRLVLNIGDAVAPDNLQKIYDVSEFGTPVQSVRVEPIGTKGTRVEINVAGKYVHQSIQQGNTYKVQFTPRSAPGTRPEPEPQYAAASVNLTNAGSMLGGKNYSGKRVSLNFQNIEVRSVLQLLADFTGLNMVVSDTVGGNITLRLKDVPWDQALDIILQTKGLASRQYGNVIMVAPIEEVAARERLELEAQQQIEELVPLDSELVQVNYAKANELVPLLRDANNKLLSERGSVTVDERTNTLLIQDTAQSIAKVRNLIAKLDRPVRQVLIESRVVIASDQFARDLGVRFGFTYGDVDGDEIMFVGGGKPGHLGGSGGFTDPSYTVEGEGGGADAEALMVNLPALLGGDRGGAANFVLGKAGEYLLQLELSAMQQEGKGEIISSPRVITSDQNKATIKQGVEIPYQEATSSGATNVSFKEAVLMLDVTPHITPDDRVIMDLEVSQDTPDFGRQVLGVPPIDTRSVETSVLVDNGETVVLGGIFEETDGTAQEKIPVLGDLPGLGYLFRQEFIDKQKRELLIFVTPKILKETMRGGAAGSRDRDRG